MSGAAATWRAALLVTALLLAVQELSAQSIRFGIKGGVPVSSYFEGINTGGPGGTLLVEPAIRRYTAGLSLELRTESGFGAEIDAMYKRAHYALSAGGFGSGELVQETSDTAFNSWDFPMLLKYRFGSTVSPFATGGFALRHIGPARQRGTETIRNLITGTTTVTTIDTADPPELAKRNYAGVVVGGGIEIGVARMRFLPEFRYTRWITKDPGANFDQLRLNPHQTEFLLGLMF